MVNVWFWSPRRISEALEFNTDIRKTRTAESRDSYKDATQRLMMSHKVTPYIAQNMVALYEEDPNQVFLVPEWPNATINRDTTIALGTTIISVVDTVVYSIGQEIFVGNSETGWEKCVVSSVGANDLTISPGTVTSYVGSAGSPVIIAPLIEAILPAGVQFSTDFPMQDVSVQFVAIKPIEIGQNPYTDLSSIPVVTDGAVSFEPIQGAKKRASVLVDSKFGSYAIAETESYQRRSGTLSFMDTTDAQRVQRRRFLHFMRGRDGEMYVPSPQADVLLNAGFTSSSLSLDIKPFTSAANMIGRSILVTQDGATAARTITSATDVSPTSQAIGVAAIGFAGTTDARVRLLTKCRFDVDEFEIAYQFSVGGLLARLSAPTIEVP